MWSISKDTLHRLREEYPAGARVELTKMSDPYNTTLTEGCRGTVRAVDDCGTIHVSWDCGSSLGVVYGEDACKVVTDTILKPCPFCGCEEIDVTDSGKCCRVWCDRCGCTMTRENEENARAAWNRRTGGAKLVITRKETNKK